MADVAVLVLPQEQHAAIPSRPEVLATRLWFQPFCRIYNATLLYIVEFFQVFSHLIIPWEGHAVTPDHERSCCLWYDTMLVVEDYLGVQLVVQRKFIVWSQHRVDGRSH